ncbi:MAG TPA: SEC-C metal-binding domain-containing protein [Xanthobacteraceae bacterium]
MALAPKRWSSIADSERLRPLLAPFIGFLDLTDPDFEPADNIDELLEIAATAIPRATIILRKIAQFSAGPAASRRSKIGRNDPCPCGSGLKYKRCCAKAQAQN